MTTTITPHGPELADLSTLSDACKMLPGRPALSTLWRWITRGVLGRDGERVRLRAHRLGRRFYVAQADVLAFARELAEAHTLHDEPAPRRAAPKSRSAARREREVTKAKAECERRFGKSRA